MENENYIFRIYKENGTNAISGWGESSGYGLTAIKQIVDPNESANEVGKEPTSIPSPFARIDLVKTAFSIVAEKSRDDQYPNINGYSVYNRIVSNTLDVAQLFFESNRQPNLEIIPWSYADNLNELLQSRNRGHNQFGETLNLYLKRDSDTYNFSEIVNGGRIFLLNYTGLSAKDEINIIGATSPSTLFFCCDNDLSYIEDLKFQNDRPFDNDYTPLYKRDIEFHKFLWALKKHIDNESVNTGFGFAEKFKEVNDYLQACYALSDSKRREALNQVDYADYEPISVGTENTQEYVEILGFEIKQRVTDFKKEIANHCGFKIKPTISVNNNILPLVLPTSKFTRKIAYVNQQSWDMNTPVPESDNRSLADRTLPGYDNVKYPYLTAGDFLEDSIIKTPYRQNCEDFHCFVSDDNESYLLPLKDKFFEFFSIDNLMGNVPGTNKKFVEVSKMAGGIKVLLRIPIVANEKEYIEYNRIYVENVDSYANAYKVVEVDLGLALMTNIKFKNEGSAIYNFALISSYDNKDVLSLACYKGNESLGGRLVGPIVRNASESKAKACMTYTLKGTNFDYIRICYKGKSSIVLPNFVKEEGADEYTFSIDFGTTNTHVEYRINDGKTIPFNIGGSDIQLKLFSDEYANTFLYVFASDIMPQCVGGDTKFKLPMRTALSFGNNTQWQQSVNPVLQAGVSFTYEKLKEFRYNATETNLKWSEEQDNIKKLECYIKSLFNILRNKVLLNGGNLAKTKVVWFYPLSMSVSRLENYKEIIISAYKEYFSDNAVNTSVKRISESVAPYIYYTKNDQQINNIVTIDIGGGTTDVVVAENSDIKAVSSFRFAANSVFGKGFANDTEGRNGIVNKFKQKCLEILKSNNESDLISVYEQIDSTNNSVDMASFLFSLKGLVKTDIKDYVDFIKLLRLDRSKKFTFLMFYSSIIYHVACLMKSKGLKMPNHIAFSGNGSRIVSVLTSDSETLSKYTKLIFEKVYEQKYDNNGLKVVLDSVAPKESTCKGGLLFDANMNYGNLNEKVVILRSVADGTFFDRNITYEDLKQHTDEYESSVVADAKEFIDFIFALHDSMRFDEYFNVDISQIKDAKNVCNKYLETYFKRGLANRIRESGENVPVEETMFFYPVIGILNALANELGND